MSFDESVMKNKWLWIGGAAVLVLALVGVVAFSASQSEDMASLEQMTEGEAGTVAEGESGLVLDEDGRVIAVVDSNDTASGTSGSSSSGDGNPPPTGNDGVDPPPPAPEGAEMTAKVLFWNDTLDSSVAGCEIFIDGIQWAPDTSKDADSDSFDGLAYDVALDLVVLPNGSGGDKFTVPVFFTSIMEPDSERDAIHVEISDGEVRVIGNAVENFDARFDRS